MPLYCQLTDLFEECTIELPACKNIALRTQVEEGVGDFIHLIRTYQVLSKDYPKRIECYTKCSSSAITRLTKIASEFNFQCHFNKEINNHETILIVDISYTGSSNPEPDAPRTYQLDEIQSNYCVQPRSKVSKMGFLPDCEGIWIDEIKDGTETGDLLLSTPSLKKLFICENLENPVQAKKWLDQAWIAQSHYYSERLFYISLFAQLGYLKKRYHDIKYLIIKYFGFNRDMKPWNCSDKFNSPEFINALSKFNVRSVILDGNTHLINNKNSIDICMFKTHLSNQDYQIFQNLLNGVVFPAGDNSYSEAYSNPNTILPPFPELRDYKIDSVDPLFNIIANLQLEPLEINWLQSLVRQCKKINSSFAGGMDVILAQGKCIAKLWASAEDPKHAWLSLHKTLKNHDLGKRLPCIIKEQILFAQNPKLEANKIRLIDYQNKPNSPEKKPVIVYRKLIEQEILKRKSGPYSPPVLNPPASSLLTHLFANNSVPPRNGLDRYDLRITGQKRFYPS